MIKGMITKLKINKKYDLKYEGFIEFRIQDDKFYCNKLNDFIKEIVSNNKVEYNYCLELLRWVDFIIYSKYHTLDDEYIYEFEIKNKLLNPNKTKSYLEAIIIE